MKKIAFIICFLCIVSFTSELELEFKTYFYKPEINKTVEECFIDKSELLFPFCGEIIFTVKTCLENDINPLVFLSLLKNENPTLNNFAVNENNNGSFDLGLCQLNSNFLEDFIYKYWNENLYGEFNVFNYQHNIIIAVKHLKTLLRNTKTVEQAVMAYNCGLSAVLNNRIPQTTKHYLEKWNENYIKMNEEGLMENHECCPKCGSKNVEITTAGYIEKNENKASCCFCGWVGVVDEMTPEKKSLFDEIMAKKETKEKEQKKEIIADLSKPETCSEEMLADYFIWVMQRKGSQYIEKIVDTMLEKLKG